MNGNGRSCNWVTLSGGFRKNPNIAAMCVIPLGRCNVSRQVGYNNEKKCRYQLICKPIAGLIFGFLMSFLPLFNSLELLLDD